MSWTSSPFIDSIEFLNSCKTLKRTQKSGLSSLKNTWYFTFPQSQTTVMKSQQDRIENNNALADSLKSQLSQAESKLAALQGNNCN